MLKLTLCQTKEDGCEFCETVDLDDCDDAEEMVKNLRACGFDIPDEDDEDAAAPDIRITWIETDAEEGAREILGHFDEDWAADALTFINDAYDAEICAGGKNEELFVAMVEVYGVSEACNYVSEYGWQLDDYFDFYRGETLGRIADEIFWETHEVPEELRAYIDTSLYVDEIRDNYFDTQFGVLKSELY